MHYISDLLLHFKLPLVGNGDVGEVTEKGRLSLSKGLMFCLCVL